MKIGTMDKRWNVVCHRCTAWDMPSGTKIRAAESMYESGWDVIGYKWICPACIKKENIYEEGK